MVCIAKNGGKSLGLSVALACGNLRPELLITQLHVKLKSSDTIPHGQSVTERGQFILEKWQMREGCLTFPSAMFCFADAHLHHYIFPNYKQDSGSPAERLGACRMSKDTSKCPVHTAVQTCWRGTMAGVSLYEVAELFPPKYVACKPLSSLSLNNVKIPTYETRQQSHFTPHFPLCITLLLLKLATHVLLPI